MSLDSNKATKDKTRIFHIGLNNKELIMIQGIFELQPTWKECFVFGEFNNRDHVDMVFVNGDDLDAIGEWQTLTLNRSEVTPVIVCSEIKKI